MNIESILLPNEQVLYTGVAVPKKGSKSIFGLIVIILFCLIPIIALGEVGQINMSIIIIAAVALLFMMLAIYGLVYNLFLKNRKIIGQKYFITNERAIIYSSRKNEFIIGYLDRFDVFRVDNEKNNFGDVYMGIVAEANDKEDTINLLGTLFNQDKNNMNSIYFESVENPYQVLEIVKKQRLDLVPDRPLLNSAEEEKTEEVKIGGQKVIVNNNPIWVWIVYSALIILFLSIPLFNIFNSIKVWSTYNKTTAIITNVEKKDVGDEGSDIKYFVNVSYEINNNNYESIITNDTCYLKSTQKFKGYTSSCRKYDSRFKSMKINNKVEIYVNPDKLTEAEYVPTLLSSSSLILLLFGLICSLPLLGKIKIIIQKIVR